MSISVAIATYNEEKSIKSCLNSVRKIADEIVLVDGNSTDNTISIGKKFWAIIYRLQNQDNFHINKQYAIDRCKSDWILQLDADEELTEDLRREIIKAVKSTKYNGFWIPRKNFFLGTFLKKGGQFPDFSLRLYRKGKGRLPCISVHEQAIVEGPTGYLNSPLLHFPYPNFSHYLEHFNRYTTFFAKELGEKNIKINLLSFLSFFIFHPITWFLSTYFRHKGFQDGFSGLIFSLYSSLRYPTAFIKYWEIGKLNRK